MRPEQRLRRPAEFAVVQRRGRGYTGDLLSLRVLRNGLELSRTGFVVSKRVGKAVTRNRVKRRLRAIVDAQPVAAGFDLVVVARPAAAASPFGSLNSSLVSLFRRAGVLQ